MVCEPTMHTLTQSAASNPLNAKLYALGDASSLVLPVPRLSYTPPTPASSLAVSLNFRLRSAIAGFP